MAGLAELKLSNRVLTILESNGIEDLDALLAMNERELLGLPRFGSACLAEVVGALNDAGLGTLAVDPYAPYVCAREGRVARDAGLSNLFLCDDCAALWEDTAFAGEPPQYVGEPVDGFCLNCNVRRDDVRLRQWFLCGICDRVARAIGRSVVAERFVVDEWDRVIAPGAPSLDLRSTDEPTLRHWDRDASSGRRAEIDFVVHDTERDEDLFGFEMKTGKGYVSGGAGVGVRIPRFQLDTSDCDAITTVMGREGVPVYLLHVQVVDRAFPPTLEYRPLGAWWTEPFAMNEHFTHVDRRPRENRNAAYYETTMFRAFESFLPHVRGNGPNELRARIAREGIPSLYS